ncbi:putative lipid phosphate phosphatase 3, chloroplastic isoform X3 [Olea europaea var. sylvestris]|uniref:putative lipid phosphate phosphatase 3, chloroplastic isoform X3 n=1 Tax=Olea europaea var. sylvestris TaxID=158386 RepID=UPI000C1D4B36|nr:putative lipid phosphate phosphatase 3, chloroplastic isoform X3 [Olea europaea var. sylvestris]
MEIGPETSAVTTDSFSELQPLMKFKNQQKGMREAELVAHTVRSHGVTVARTHMHDWLILMLLGVILVILKIINPFYRFVGKDMMSDLKYPLKSNTVPVWLVPIYAVLLPVAVFLLFYVRRRDVYDLHHAVLAGILFSILITGVLTDVIKDAVGRPRPDFFWRCFPDGKDAYDQWGNVVCHGDKSVIREGHKSFPSGHTSWSFAGLGFLSLYLSGKLKVFDRRGHIAKLCLVLLPLLVASLVGISRVDDYWHHWQDVFAGGLLGLVVATFCYLQFFPPPYHVDGWGTYAYFGILESRSNVNNLKTSEAMVEIQQNERKSNAVIGISSSGSPSLPVEDLESGRSGMQENNSSSEALTGSSTSAVSLQRFTSTNPFLSPTSPTYLNPNPYRYSTLFPQNYSPNSPSETASFDGGDIAATEESLHEASRILEYQQLYNRHTVCLARLHEYINEVDSLRCENNSLRLSNADLTRRLTLLVNQNCLLSDFNRLNIVPSPTVSFPTYATHVTSSQPLIEENHMQRTPERVTIPKSISVRSSGYLKTRMDQDVTRQQVAGEPGLASQRVYVPGSKREEEALEFEVYNQGMFKTELCNKWQESGECPYGDNCQFAHGIKELRPVIRHPRYKTEVCRMVLAGDICPYGHRCHFRHALTEQERLMAMAPAPR